MRKYNLITEKWIPITTLNGVEERVSLMECFERAHEIEKISHGNTLVEAAVQEFLLIFPQVVDQSQ